MCFSNTCAGPPKSLVETCWATPWVAFGTPGSILCSDYCENSQMSCNCASQRKRDIQLGAHAMPSVTPPKRSAHRESLAKLGFNHKENRQNDMILPLSSYGEDKVLCCYAAFFWSSDVQQSSHTWLFRQQLLQGQNSLRLCQIPS